MHSFPRFFCLAGAGLLLSGCASWSTEERVTALEGQMQNQQVIDLRVSHVEDRLSRVEGELGDLRGGSAASGKQDPKKAGAKVSEKQYAVKGGKTQEEAPAPAPKPVPVAKTKTSSTAAAAPQTVAVIDESPAPVTGPAAVNGYAGATQPYDATPGGRKVEPRPVAASAAPAPAASPKSAPAPVHTAAAEPAPSPESSPASSSASSSGSGPAPSLTPLSLSSPAPVSPAPTGGRPVSPHAAQLAPAGKKSSGYDTALALFNKGQYAKAQEEFSAFLQGSPSSSLAPNAMYWLGECYYSQGKFDTAIVTFKDVAAKYPKHDKAAAALLKTGFSYAKIKDMTNAKFYWQILIDDFPGSGPAQIARKRMTEG